MPASFTVNGVKAGLFASGQLTIGVTGKKTKPKAQVKDDGGGKYSVTYKPSEPDDHQIAICYLKQHIPGSPFRATILEQPAAASCVAHGGCLAKKPPLIHGDPLEMFVTTKKAGHGRLRATAIGPDHKPAGVFLAEEKDREVAVRVETKTFGPYTVNVLWNDEHIPRSPFQLEMTRRLTAADMSVSSCVVCLNRTIKTIAQVCVFIVAVFLLTC